MSIGKWKATVEAVAKREGVERVDITLVKSGHLRVALSRGGVEREIYTSATPSDQKAHYRVRQSIRRAYAEG